MFTDHILERFVPEMTFNYTVLLISVTKKEREKKCCKTSNTWLHLIDITNNNKILVIHFDT